MGRQARLSFMLYLAVACAPHPAVTPASHAQPAERTTCRDGTDNTLRVQDRIALDEAHALLTDGAYSGARRKLRGLLDSAASSPAARVRAAIALSRVEARTGQWDDARKAARQVHHELSKCPCPVAARWHLAVGDIDGAQGAYPDAMAHARTALSLEPDNLRAAFALGRLNETLGSFDEAVEAYRVFDEAVTRPLPTDPADLVALGRGLMRFSVLTRHPQLTDRTTYVLQHLFQRACRFDRTYWPAHVAAGDLLRRKFQNEQAVAEYEAALRINGGLPEGHLGIGWIALHAWDFEEVESRCQRARESNPRVIDSFRLEAALRQTERRYQAAAAAADAALAINPHDVPALGYRAAAAIAIGDHARFEQLRSAAYRVSRAPVPFHRIVADALGALRQYAACEAEYKKAIELDPTDPHPQTELGLMYMQWGRESAAHDALAAAWELDPFDARTLNTLNLLKKLDGFARHETEHFVIKYDASVDALLVPYLAEHLEQVYEDLVIDYPSADMSRKTIIEVLPTHRMFGVRITGKPWIHTVGACTGWVVALESPRDDPTSGQQPYDVARVLRHEFTHTVTLAATGNRIPHWLTEGLAVWQEDAPRPFRWTELLAEAARRGELFTLESIDWGFVRPRRTIDRELAYAQSEWMCEFIIEQFGHSAIGRMLAGFRDGHRQDDVLLEVLGVGRGEFDTRFASWAREQAADWGFDASLIPDPSPLRKAADASPDDPDVLARLARAEYDHGHIERAMAAARAALRFDEDQPTALEVMGEIMWAIRSENDDPALREAIDGELIPAMLRLLKQDDEAVVALESLGNIALEKEALDDARIIFEQLKRVQPRDTQVDRALASIHLLRGENDDAVPYLRAVAEEDTGDAELRRTLAVLLEDQHRLGDARHWYLRSVHIDARDAKTHAQLAALCERMNDTGCAAREYEALTLLEPTVARHFERAAELRWQMGEHDKAQQLARAAVALDADSPAGELLDNR